MPRHSLSLRRRLTSRRIEREHIHLRHCRVDPIGAKIAQPCFDSIFSEVARGGAVAIV
jgi:hypothetical protein